MVDSNLFVGGNDAEALLDADRAGFCRVRFSTSRLGSEEVLPRSSNRRSRRIAQQLETLSRAGNGSQEA